MNLKDLSFTEDWALFLDRDGVINRRITGGYVKRWEEFFFLDGVLASLATLKNIFRYILIVSNQQGVGKGLMSAADLHLIDRKMKEFIAKSGGRIDAAYYSTYLETEAHPDRKPGIGLGMKAKEDFPGIDFSKSVMAGDTLTDMEFGRKLGMINVLISTDPEVTARHDAYDFRFDSLHNFTITFTQLTNDQ